MKGSTFLIWIAQGLGSGRSPVAPGTAGSCVGIAWLCLLLWTGNVWLFGLGAVGGIFLSVWICGAAALYLGQSDPPSVVLDELIAVPLCFVGWITWVWLKEHELPGPLRLFDSSTWYITAALLGLFRIFDILKPWPVFQAQALPGGWGITLDDVLAAVYVNLCWLGFLAIGRLTT